MSRKYPRFLFSNPANSKSKGSFIIHSLEPRFIVSPKFGSKRNIEHCELLEIWSPDYDKMEVNEIVKEIPSWFRNSGMQQSNNDDDIVISTIHNFEFLQNKQEEFSVEDVVKIIKTLFPSRAKKIFEGSSSYGLKHLMEHISQFDFDNTGSRISKYCGNDTLINAFEIENFKYLEDEPNRYFNLSAREVNRAYRLFWNA